MYKCIRSITIYPSTHLGIGDFITEDNYESLNWIEKQSFEKVNSVNTESDPSDDDISIIDSAIDIFNIGVSVASIFQDTPSQESPTFDGFDGGDFGGAGAGGDF